MTSPCVQVGVLLWQMILLLLCVCVCLQLLRRKRRGHSNKTLKKKHSPAWGLLPGAVFLRAQTGPLCVLSCSLIVSVFGEYKTIAASQENQSMRLIRKCSCQSQHLCLYMLEAFLLLGNLRTPLYSIISPTQPLAQTKGSRPPVLRE